MPSKRSGLSPSCFKKSNKSITLSCHVHCTFFFSVIIITRKSEFASKSFAFLQKTYSGFLLFAQVRRDMPPVDGRGKGDILFREREYPLWNPKRKAFRLAVSGLNDLDASGMEIPARGVAAFSPSIRFGLLLFSLSLCLRFVTLTQFPTTSDLYKLAIACQGGIAGARRNIRTIGRR